MTVLCIEVGHTRFKATTMVTPLTLKSLKATQIIVGRSAPWLQQNLYLLFTKSLDSPLSPFLEKRPDMVSLSIFGPISNRSKHVFWQKARLPEHLKDSLQNTTSRRVMIDGDAVSWAIGALEYLKLNSAQVTFPCLALTLGTGVGAALIGNVDQIKAIEIWIMDPSYPRLGKYAVTKNSLKSPRQLLEKAFLDKISGGEEFTDIKMKTYRPEYNLHFQAFVEDACEEIEKKLQLQNKILSVLVGGGYSRFIDEPKDKSRTTFVLNPQKLIKEGFLPDIVQLLGCLRHCHMPAIRTDTYPDFSKTNN